MWLVVAVSAVFAFERHVTLPYCREACSAAGDALESYRQYTRGGPPEACLCHSGKEIRPGLLHNPIGMTIVTLLVGPVVFAHAWAGVRAARKRRPPAVPKPGRR